MMGISRRTKAIVLVGILIVTGSAIVYSLNFTEGEYVHGYGFCYISEIQGANSNVSYSIDFHGVNFTFLHWYWPLFTVMDNVTAFVAEQRVQVHVMIEFSDGIKEAIQFEIDSPSSCLIGPDSTLLVYPSNHASQFAAVATANTEVLQSNWVYLVSV
jgi:hypothetical protein